VDVPATITVLAEATAGWDAVETDLRAAAGKPTTELESVLVATQVCVTQDFGGMCMWLSFASSGSETLRQS
jgi:hypothetical protein